MALARVRDRLSRGLRFFRHEPAFNQLDRMTADSQRIAEYAQYGRWYEGYIARGVLATGDPTHLKRLKYNFCRPIVNIPAGWLAGTPIVWDVRADDGSTNEEASEAAKRIWDRSGAERAFLEAAITAGIYGDACLKVVQERDDPEALPTLEFLCPDVCFPLFGGHDHSELLALEVAYVVTVGVEEAYTRHEYYDADGAEIFHGDTLVDRFTYEALPAVWVRNNRLPGRIYGTSDLNGLVDLIDEYDHVARKQTSIIDYYANPRIVFEGVTRGTLVLDVNTALYLPQIGQKAYFLEWSGSGPAVEDQLTRIRNAIAEIAQVPAVALGQMDKGYTTISGIGLKILYGPLLDKVRRKQAAWGPALERAMWLALGAMGIVVPLPSINAIFPDPTPVDPKAEVEREALAVEKGLKSHSSAMRAIGVEDPDAELKKMVEERDMLAPPELQAPGEERGEEEEEDEDAGRSA